MPDVDRRLLAVTAVGALLLILIGLGIGRLTASGTTPLASDTDLVSSTVQGSNPLQEQDSPHAQGPDDEPIPSSTTTIVPTVEGDAAAVLPPPLDVPDDGIPTYGTEVEQDWFLIGVAGAGVTGTSRDDLLATGYHVCYMLERLQAQDRSPSFAVRVIWNESLAELESEDLAAFAAVYQAAPLYLCPDSVEYGIEVAYWLGY